MARKVIHRSHNKQQKLPFSSVWPLCRYALQLFRCL